MLWLDADEKDELLVAAAVEVVELVAANTTTVPVMKV